MKIIPQPPKQFSGISLTIDGNLLSELIEACISSNFEKINYQPESKEFVSQKELAQRIGLSVPKIIQMKKAGIIPGVCIGNKWKFEVSEVWEALKAYQNNQVQAIQNGKKNGR